MRVYVGIDLAFKSSHKAYAVTAAGDELLSGYRFRTDAEDLDRLVEKVESMAPGAEVWSISEPTGSVWRNVGAYLKSKGWKAHIVSNQKAHDLRRFLHRHTKTDAVDAEALAQMGRIAPEALQPIRIDPKAQSLLRWAKRYSKASLQLASLKRGFVNQVEEVLPGVGTVAPDLLTAAGKAFYRHYISPMKVRRLGLKRFAGALEKRAGRKLQPGAAQRLFDFALKMNQLSAEGVLEVDFTELEDLVQIELDALEAKEEQLARLKDGLVKLYRELHPSGALHSIQGVGEVTAASCLAILLTHSFPNAKHLRSYLGVIPRVNESGVTTSKGSRLTKQGPAWVRRLLYIAAESARRWDPQLAEVYRREMVDKANPHRKAVLAVVTRLVDRIWALYRDDRGYELRDQDGNSVSAKEARAVVTEHLEVPKEVRARLKKQREEDDQEKREEARAEAPKGRGQPKAVSQSAASFY